MNKTIQNDEILTKSFFLEVMHGVNKNLEGVNTRLDKLEYRTDKIEKKLEVHDGNFIRIYDGIDDLSIKIEKYREENQKQHQITRNDMNGHFDHIYKKLEEYDDEWACINAWISRQKEKNECFTTDIKLLQSTVLEN